MPAAEFLSSLMRSAFNRGAAPNPDGGPAPKVAPLQASATAPDITSERTEPDGAEPADPLDSGLTDILAEKVLLAWLRNRYQLLFPFALDLRRLDERQAELLVHAMIAAAQADGALDGKERERIEGALRLVEAGDHATALLDAALSRPKPLNEILGQVHDVQSGALVYAASLMSVDQRKPVNRLYLRYLAARLQLSEELVGSLEQRFRSSA